eukprot:TRINITY_DN15743_c0_g1_i2.p1 TRINITY_DN15743_c0_g1~~TRINITY_DN15743_c0_g1_i2.p1  ORF type:complete len:1382 (+),score=200.96 TRINITY_DN15743_c0_g1_i2:191-4336(+)
MAADVICFGTDVDLTYNGHGSQASHLAVLPRNAFVTADDTAFHKWGAEGTIVKKPFPSNRRSIVCALTYCPMSDLVLTVEVDLTIKAYVAENLGLADSFVLSVLRNGKSYSDKFTSLACLPNHNWILLGGDRSLELWTLTKTTRRRQRNIGRLEHHLQLAYERLVSSENVRRLVVDDKEGRVIVLGVSQFSVYDLELSLLAMYHRPQGSPFRCACIRIMSLLETVLLTGSEGGAVDFWSLKGTKGNGNGNDRDADEETVYSESPPGSPRNCSPADDETKQRGEDSAYVRLEHTFNGHTRTVEIVNFYHGPDRENPQQRLCVSCGRDAKLRVWSLVEFTIIYVLDLPPMDSRAVLFPVAPNLFGVSVMQDADKDGGQQATITLLEFTAKVAVPFATSNHSPVVQMARSPMPLSWPAATKRVHARPYDFSVLVSDDMAVRISDGRSSRAISTLPPPPNSKVQVLDVFFCPVWQILVLWMSSEEIAIFFVPLPPLEERQRTMKHGGRKGASLRRKRTEHMDRAVTPGEARAKHSTTPLLLRRFSIRQICASVPDRELQKEVFRSVVLYYGRSPQNVDALTTFLGKSETCATAEPMAEEEVTQDWFLMVGTLLGTVQAFRLRDILGACQIWQRMSVHLPPGAWRPEWTGVYPKPAREGSTGQQLNDEGRTPGALGQREFPRGAPPILLHGRWKHHYYPVEVTRAAGSRLMTIDMKRNIRVFQVELMHCLFAAVLEPFSCFAPYLQPEPSLAAPSEGDGKPILLNNSPWEDLGLAGVALGCQAGPNEGGLDLIVIGSLDGKPTTLHSTSSHNGPPLMIDFTWPSNCFVSIGLDHTVKLWSRTLVHLRDIVFPAPLTSVAFRQSVMDGVCNEDHGAIEDVMSQHGHGDVLVGFAAHVESVAYRLWSRGVAPGHLGKESTPPGTNEVVWYSGADSDVSTGAFSPSKVRQLDDSFSAGYVAAVHEREMKPDYARATTRGASEEESKIVDAGASVQETRPVGSVMDFRGAPHIAIRGLAGQAVVDGVTTGDKMADNPHRRVPAISLERELTNGPEDYRGVTHYPGTLCEQPVRPANLSDAKLPRTTAVRGGCDDKARAMVLSVSGMEMMECAFRPPQKTKLVEETNRPDQSGAQMTSENKRPDVDDVSQQAIARATSTTTAATVAIAARVADFNDEEGPAWRSKHIGRGVPEEKPRPQKQATSGTQADSLVMLQTRGDFRELVDDPGPNMLARLTVKKADWLYTPRDSAVTTARRPSTSENLAVVVLEDARAEPAPVWSPSGRLLYMQSQPPLHALPAGYQPPPPLTSRPRMPFTRQEVTERLIIEAAMNGPPPRDMGRVLLSAATDSPTLRRPIVLRPLPPRRLGSGFHADSRAASRLSPPAPAPMSAR